MLAALVDWLGASGITTWAGSGTVYPLANLVHLLGLVLLLGSIGLVDLRLLGAFASLPADALARALTPLGVTGLVLQGLSGSVLFAADAASLIVSATLGWKLAAIALALANAAAFRWLLRPGLAMRIAAAVSLGSWLAVATLGRMIAYS